MQDVLISHVAKLLTKRVLAWLVSKLPFLSFGPLNWIASFFLEKLVRKIMELTFLGATILYIRFSSARDLRAMRKILDELKDIEEMTPEQEKDFDERLAKAGRDLIKFKTIS